MKNKAFTERKDTELNAIDLQQPSNVVKLAYAGSDDPPNWLINLPIGTVFLSRRKPTSVSAQQDFSFGEFCVYNKTDKAMLLAVIDGGAPRPLWVDPYRFTNQMDFIEVVRTQQFTEVGDKDDEDIGTV